LARQKSIGEICRLKICVDIAGDRLPLSDGNEYIIIKKKNTMIVTALSAAVARCARAEPPYGLYSHRAQ
jgi:hypothetical protein